MKPVTSSTSRDSRLKSVFGNTISSVLFRRDRLWIMLLTAAAVVLLVGWWANRNVEEAVKANIASQLQTLLEADVEALQVWMGSEQQAAKAFAQRDDVISLVDKLREIASSEDSGSIKADLLSSESLADLRETVDDWGSDYGALGFLVIDKNFRVLAGEQDDGIGDTELAKEYATKLQPVLNGESAFFYPTRSRRAFEDIDGVRRAGIPVMYVVAPIPSKDGTENSVFGLRLRPEATFSRLLSVASFGNTGETYAFNREGVMLTNSRFDNELKRIGLLLDEENSRSLLNISIRDPGVDMTKGFRPKLRRSEQPLTKMAQNAIESGPGHDIAGYRDYRGVPVIGAWTWLPEYDIGVATEVDVEEAYQPLYALRKAFWILTGLLGLAALVNGWLAFYASKMEYKAREAAVSAKRLGQYSLDNKLGEGGMGTVYRAHHDMLRRPTAVKLLNIEKTNEQTIARFEREVQLTSQLTHPNTIAIYDYGRTPEGVFYYAMEYLEGFELVDLIKQHGPQNPGRVIFILKQVCKSLAEAHEKQLIHRDVKPGNIMLTRRGGMGDFVKLLDFGLVKSQEDSLHVTAADSILGTPHYMPPEVMTSQELDARSDLYSLGGVAYYLLTAKTVFDGKNIAEICMKHARETPVSPSERLGRPIDTELEKVVLSCLEKERDDRPQSANELWEALDSCSACGSWAQRDADDWWTKKLRGAIDTDDFRMGDTQQQDGDLDETMDQADWDKRSGK